MRCAARILVSGTVQGVGFRYLVRDEANNRGIVGYIENLKDGTVTIECEGEKEDIEELVKSIRGSQAPIHVSDLNVQYSEDAGRFNLFKIMLGKTDDELVEGLTTGATYLIRLNNKQDQMLNKQDQMIDKQDQMLNKQDQMIDKQDQMLNKQDQMIDKQDQMIDKQDQMIDKQDQMIDKQDQMIDKQDQMLNKQDQTIEEIRNASSNFHRMFDSRFERIESDISVIKSKLQM